MATQDDKAHAAAAPAAAAPVASAAAAPAASSAQSASAAAANNAPSAAAPASTAASSSTSAAAAPAAPATSATASSSAAAAAPPKKQWSAADIAQVPEGADPLDYINMEKLKEDNKNMPTTKEGINEFLQTMPITADIMPDRADQNRDFCGIQSLIDETPIDVRAENFKDSGNEAYKLALRMKKDWTEGTAKREEAEKARVAAGLPAPVLTPQQQKDEDYEVTHLKKLIEGHSKRLQDAIIYYTQGLDVELDQELTDKGRLKISKHLKAQLHVNRALVHSTLQNYGRAQEDCDAALKLEPANPKACYRGALACLACHPPKLAKARSYIAAGAVRGPAAEARKKKDWQFRAEQKALDDVEARVVALEEVERAKEAKKSAIEAEKQTMDVSYAQSLAQALASRGIKLGPLVFDFAQTPYLAQSKEPGRLPRPYLTPAPPAPYNASTTRLSWPLLFLYPEVLQSDFVTECREEDTIADHLGAMFPPKGDWAPWDEKRQYRMDNLAVYVDVRGPNVPANSSDEQDAQNRMLVNPAHSLRSILSNPKLGKRGYVVPGIPTFIVLPKQ